MLPLLISALVGCKKPIEAPQAFDELCAYLYEHAWDDDQEALVAGLDSMATFLDQDWDVEDSKDGYEVGKISEEAFDAVDDQDRTTKGMIGLALPTESHHSVLESTCALVVVDQSEIFDDFTEYDRTYLSGPDCFVERTCEHMEAEEDMFSDFGWGFTSASNSMNQYSWADMSTGAAMVHRNWQIVPPENSSLMPEVDQQAYLNVFIPITDESAWRVQAQWTGYDGDLSDAKENSAKILIVNFFEDAHAQLEAWLDENEVP